MKRSFNVVALSQADYRTAMDDLDATEQQAFLVAVKAAAWRAVAVLLPIGLVISLVLLAGGVRPWPVDGLPLATAALGALVAAMIIGLPASFVAGGQTFYRVPARRGFGSGLAAGWHTSTTAGGTRFADGCVPGAR